MENNWNTPSPTSSGGSSGGSWSSVFPQSPAPIQGTVPAHIAAANAGGPPSTGSWPSLSGFNQAPSTVAAASDTRPIVRDRGLSDTDQTNSGELSTGLEFDNDPTDNVPEATIPRARVNNRLSASELSHYLTLAGQLLEQLSRALGNPSFSHLPFTHVAQVVREHFEGLPEIQREHLTADQLLQQLPERLIRDSVEFWIPTHPDPAVEDRNRDNRAAQIEFFTDQWRKSVERRSFGNITPQPTSHTRGSTSQQQEAGPSQERETEIPSFSRHGPLPGLHVDVPNPRRFVAATAGRSSPDSQEQQDTVSRPDSTEPPDEEA